MKRTDCFDATLARMREFRLSLGLSVVSFDSLAAMFTEYVSGIGGAEGELTKDIAEGWLKWESEHGRRDIRSKCSFLRSMASYVDAMGGLAYHLPCRWARPRRRTTPYIYTDADLARLFAAIDAYDDTWKCSVPGTFSVLFRLIYTCGLRPGEGYGLLMRDVDFGNGRIRILGSKMHKERIVVMSDDMLGLMRRYRDRRVAIGREDGHVFLRADGRPLNMPRVKDVLLRCWRKANPDVPQKDLPRVRVYDFRHRFATANLLLWQAKGLDSYAMLPRLRTYMGHDHISATLYYTHLMPTDMSAKAACLGALESIIPEVSP